MARNCVAVVPASLVNINDGTYISPKKPPIMDTIRSTPAAREYVLTDVWVTQDVPLGVLYQKYNTPQGAMANLMRVSALDRKRRSA